MTLLSSLFKEEEGPVCFSFYLMADKLCYKLYQAGVFSKFGVTLPLSATTSSSLGSSWSTQCNVNVPTNSIQQLFQANLQPDFRLDLVLFKYCLFYPRCDLCTIFQSTGSSRILITFAKLDIYEAE